MIRSNGQTSNTNQLEKVDKAIWKPQATTAQTKKRRNIKVNQGKRKAVRQSLRVNSVSTPFLLETDNTP